MSEWMANELKRVKERLKVTNRALTVLSAAATVYERAVDAGDAQGVITGGVLLRDALVTAIPVCTENRKAEDA